MLKYVDARVVFAEVPDEVTLAINISNCPCQCKGCHSSYLAKDVGTPLNIEELTKLIEANDGITCVAIMGGDSNPLNVAEIAWYIKSIWDNLKVAWYSGRQELHRDIQANIRQFDFIKLGPYIEELGPLTSKTTNQRFYWVCKVVSDYPEEIKGVRESYYLINMTDKFWKDDNNNEV